MSEGAEFPPGVDPTTDGMLGLALHGGWRVDPGWRRWATYDNPVLWAWTYNFAELASRETNGVRSYAQVHLDLCDIARSWMVPGAHRDAIVVPRGGAKTTWLAKILVPWALAHGWRSYALLVSDSESQATGHLDDVRYWLTGSDDPGKQLLRSDFPELTPVHGQRNNSTTFQSRGGGRRRDGSAMPPARYEARGMDSKSLGMSSGGLRPDLIILDDIEPDEARYGGGVKAGRLASLTQKLLPMNERAAVVINGTVTVHGSLMHDVVLAAAGGVSERWIGEEGFTCRHYPAVEVDAFGCERSFWPERYSLPYLHSIRGTRNYALNFAGAPPPPGARLWTESTFNYLQAPVPCHRRALWVDVNKAGASTQARHDFTAIVRAARAIGRPEIVIEWAQQRRESYPSTNARIAEQCRQFPDIDTVYCEVNAFGSEAAMRNSIKVPSGVRLVAVWSTRPKDVRIKDSLAVYELNHVWHLTRLSELEDQQMRWPQVDHDDLVDCAAMATEELSK